MNGLPSTLVLGGARSGKSAPTLVRVGEVSLPLGAVRDGEVVQADVVSQALRQLWSRAKFEAKEVVIGVGRRSRSSR